MTGQPEGGREIARVAAYWPVAASWAWLAIVFAFAGAKAVFFSGVTGLLVCALAVWEAGRQRRAHLLKGTDA